MNKEQLEKLSDFEINLEVAKSIFGAENAVFAGILPDNPMVEVVLPNAWRVLHVDYCDNWSDMGPLILECGIIVDGSGSAMVVVDGEYKYITHHKNPLRAAAIVYILMQEK